MRSIAPLLRSFAPAPRSVTRSVLLCGLLLQSMALAQTPGDEPSKPLATAPPPSAAAAEVLDHRYQFGLALRAGSGYRVIMPYDEEPCGDGDKSVCGGRQPAWLELSPSFGVTSSLELLVDVRLGLEDDFTASKALHVAPGIKYYPDPEGMLKFYASGQVVLETQDQPEGSGLASFDVGARSALGLQVDLLRYVGLFAQGGVTVGFRRWLTFVVDFAGGVQVRY